MTYFGCVSLLVTKTTKTVTISDSLTSERYRQQISSPTSVINIDVVVKNVYLDTHHRYSSLFLIDLHPNNPDHMSEFLFAHQIHMKHCN